jgi:hypothetical protein
MGLTGAGFAGSLTVAALVGVAVSVWLLPRYCGPGGRRFAARTALLWGGQAILLLALLVLINSSMGFYSSWRDLFGMDAGAVRVQDLGARPWAAVPAAAPARDSLTRLLPARDGRLDALAVRGPRSGISAHVHVYLPPAYTHTRRGPAPVLLFLASARDLIARRRLPSVAARQIAIGRLRPALIVIAPVGVGCVDAPGRAQGETFFSQDLPALIGATYHLGDAPGGWSVAGASRPAAYCAAMLAMRHSDRFGAAVFTAAGLTPPAGDLYGGSRLIQEEYDPRWRIRHRPPPPVDVGVVGDDGFAAQARPPLHADALPATVWDDLPAVLHWLDVHSNAGSRT